jgi:hypothetical protein
MVRVSGLGIYYGIAGSTGFRQGLLDTLFTLDGQPRFESAGRTDAIAFRVVKIRTCEPQREPQTIDRNGIVASPRKPGNSAK